MQLFRLKYVSNVFALFTAVVFLNMSFFLAEVTALKMDKDKQLLENITKLLAGSSEEEKDVFGGSAEEDSSVSEIDLIFIYHTHTAKEYTLISKSASFLSHGPPIFGNYEIESPPPEA